MTGKMADKGKQVSAAQIIIADIVSAGAVILTGVLCKAIPAHMFDWGLGWYPAIVVVPGICATLSLLSRESKIQLYTAEWHLSGSILLSYI